MNNFSFHVFHCPLCNLIRSENLEAGVTELKCIKEKKPFWISLIYGQENKRKGTIIGRAFTLVVTITDPDEMTGGVQLGTEIQKGVQY